MNSFFDEDIDILDPNRLSKEALVLYETYLQITGLKELPNSDFTDLNMVAREYNITSLCEAMKGIAKKESFIKAKENNKIKDFRYFIPFLNMFKNTRIVKDNFQYQFDNIKRFLEEHQNNENFLVLKEYIDNGKIAIIDSNETKIIHEIIEDYNLDEIKIAIEDCRDNNGKEIYALKFLLYILRRNRSDNKRLSAMWEQEQIDMNTNINTLDYEMAYKEPETEEEREYYSKKNEELMKELIEMSQKHKRQNS